VQAPPTPIQQPIKQEVKTVKASAPVAAPKAPPVPVPKPPALKAPPSTPKAAPAKKAVPTTPAKKVEKATPKQVKSEPVVPENLVRQLQENIAKIEQKSHKGSPSTSSPVPSLQTPKWTQQLKIDEGTFGEESVFVASLIQCLQDALDLPEMGSVKVELMLKKDGSFMQMKVLKSESEKNKKFLEQEVKKIKFPPFSGSLKDEKEHVFVVTFCNS